MLRTAALEPGYLSVLARWRSRAAQRVARFGTDRTGSTAIEYGLTLAGLALSVSGVSAAVGVDVAAIFDHLELEICKQTYSLCVAR